MDVAQGDVVEGLVQRGVDIVQRSDGALLALVKLAAEDQLVRENDVAVGGVRMNFAENQRRGVVCVLAFLVREEAAHNFRVDVRHQVKRDHAVIVGGLDGADVPVVDRGEKDAGVADQLAEIRHALGRVVVAADDQDQAAQLLQPVHEAAEERHRLGGGIAAVVDVPGDQDSLDLLFLGNTDDLVQDVLLILEKGHVNQALAEMEVGQMEKFHGSIHLFALKFSGKRAPESRSPTRLQKGRYNGIIKSRRYFLRFFSSSAIARSAAISSLLPRS